MNKTLQKYLCLLATSLFLLPAMAAQELVCDKGPGSPRTASSVVRLCGNVYFSDKSGASRAHMGMYKFTSNDDFDMLAPSLHVNVSAYGQIFIDGTYYMCRKVNNQGIDTPYFETYNADTWALTSSEPCDISFLATVLTQDPTTGTVYGVFYNEEGTGFEWCTVDLPARTRTAIASLPGNFNAVAFDNYGQGFAIDYDGNLLKINKATGETTLVGATGYVPKYMTGACFERKTNRMFWTLTPEDETGNLLEVNTDTGVATKLCKFKYNDMISGIYDLYNPNGNALSAPENVTLSKQDGAFVLTWNPVTTNSIGTDIDASKVRYKVCRFPGDVTVAENLDATVFTENVGGNPYKTYYYSVQAFNGSNESAVSESNSLSQIEVGLPYSQDFTEESAMQQYTIIDANADGYKFRWNEKGFVRINDNDGKTKNDWLILPKLRLEPDKVYHFTMKADAPQLNNRTYSEKVRVCLGKYPSVNLMTKVLTAPPSFTGEHIVDCYVTVPETDYYYIGIHGCSSSNENILDIDDIAVDAGVERTVPNQVTDILIQPESGHIAYGKIKSTVSFKTPAVNFYNESLTELSKVEVLRDNELIRTFDNPTPGECITFRDEVGTAGKHTYRFIPYNTVGSGGAVSVEYNFPPGAGKPEGPHHVKAKQIAPGVVKVTWDAVTKDENGNLLSPDQIRYKLIDYDRPLRTIYAEDVEGTEWTIENMVSEGEQIMVSIAAVAVTNGGESWRAHSDYIPVGTPYPLPFVESFANGRSKHVYNYYNTISEAHYEKLWLIRSDAAHYNVTKASDDDNGYLESYLADYKFTGVSHSIYSGSIDLTSAEEPVMLFKLFNPGGRDWNNVEVSVRETGTDNWTSLLEGEVDELCNHKRNAWSEHIECELYDFRGKVIEWKINVSLTDYHNTLFDDIRVIDVYDSSLEAHSVIAPATVKPYSDFDVRVNVFNNGNSQACNYTVVLTDGEGNELEACEGTSLDPRKTAIYTFQRKYSPLEEAGTRRLGAKVVWTDDVHQEDNTASPVEVVFEENRLPASSDLAVTDNGTGYPRLVWTAPVVSGDYAVTVTEDFEGFDPFTFENQKGWTFVDMDGSPVSSLSIMPFQSNAFGTITGSFFALDSTHEGFDESYNAHSGNRYIASFQCHGYDIVADDWAISPLLSGNAQTVTLWSKSDHEFEGAAIRIKFYYTNTDNTYPGEYTETRGTLLETTDDGWRKYSFDVPEGAVRFAIRNNDGFGYMLGIDDVTMEIDSSDGSYNTPRMAGLTCTGYNIYRDGVKINENPVALTTYEDTNVLAGDYNYNVTALFDNGREGPVSNTATFTVGVDEIGTDALSISVDGNAIVVVNAAGRNVTVNTASGTVVYNGTGDARVEVAAGIYIVKAGNRVAKVMVK